MAIHRTQGPPRSRARLRVVVAVVLTVVALLAVPTGQADAQSRHPSTRTCAGLGKLPNGPRMWRDEHGGAGSQLAKGIDALICSAADGATIRIKSWFMTTGGTAMQRMVKALALMHRYHRVHVEIFVARSWYGAAKWKSFRRAVSFATVGWCAHACRSGLPGSLDHSKWITVSQLRSRDGGGTAVLSTSLNPMHEQFASRQSGIVILRDLSIYGSFIREWNSYVRCGSGRGCNHVIRNGTWLGRNGTQVWFEPSKLDPTHLALQQLSCRHGGEIDVMSLFLARGPVVNDLLRLRSEGCTVRVLLEHWNPEWPAPWNKVHPRCAFSHDKMVLIRVGSVREVIAGSQDQLSREVFEDDNQMVRTANPSVVAAYASYFANGWYSPKTTNCANGGFFGGPPSNPVS